MTEKRFTVLSESNKEVTRRYLKAYETGDIEAVMKFRNGNYVLHLGGGGEQISYEARKLDEMGFFSAFSNVETVVEDQIAEGDEVMNRITMHCTHTGEYQGIAATGKRITITYIDIVRIKGGKIVEEWVEFDMTSILQQIRT